MSNVEKHFITFAIGICVGIGIGYWMNRPLLTNRRLILMEVGPSEKVAGKVECTIDGKHWFPSRSDNNCYLEDAPQ